MLRARQTIKSARIDLSRAFIKAIYSPFASTEGFSTSIWSMLPGAYKSSTRLAFTSTLHHESDVCISPRKRAASAPSSGRICGTAQYATNSSLGDHTHLSAVVRMGSVIVLAFGFVRAERINPAELER